MLTIETSCDAVKMELEAGITGSVEFKDTEKYGPEITLGLGVKTPDAAGPIGAKAGATVTFNEKGLVDVGIGAGLTREAAPPSPRRSTRPCLASRRRAARSTSRRGS